MENATGMESPRKSPVEEIIETAKKVILAPVEFYRGMPKIGGLVDPLIFALVLGVVSGVIQAVLGLLHLGVRVSVMEALSMIILAPIWIVVGSFIGGAILFVIWKLMGSNESFETAYRCGAYASATSPIMAVLGVIPLVGSLAGLVWILFLLVTASVEVHKLPAKKAWLVFGIIAAVLAAGSYATAKKAQRDYAGFEKAWGGKPGKDMTAEEAGKAAAAMMKAMQAEAMKELEKAKAEAEKESGD